MIINEAWLAAHNADPARPASIQAHETAPDPVAEWDLSGELEDFYQPRDLLYERRLGNVR